MQMSHPGSLPLSPPPHSMSPRVLALGIWETSPVNTKVEQNNQIMWDVYFLGAISLPLYMEGLFRESCNIFRKDPGLLKNLFFLNQLIPFPLLVLI